MHSSIALLPGVEAEAEAARRSQARKVSAQANCAQHAAAPSTAVTPNKVSSTRVLWTVLRQRDAIWKTGIKRIYILFKVHKTKGSFHFKEDKGQ